MQAWKLIVAGLLVAALTTGTQADDKIPLCSTKDFPVELQNQIRDKFVSWKIQDELTIAPYTKQRWQAEKPLECPGIATGRFESSARVSYAILLVPENDPDAAYKLALYAPSGNGASDALRVIEEWNKGGASHYFIRKTEISKFFSRHWITKLHVKTDDGILIFDAA